MKPNFSDRFYFEKGKAEIPFYSIIAIKPDVLAWPSNNDSDTPINISNKIATMLWVGFNNVEIKVDGNIYTIIWTGIDWKKSLDINRKYKTAKEKYTYQHKINSILDI